MNIQHIKKQVWEIRLKDESLGFDVQNEIKSITLDHISPILDEICNEIVGEDVVLKIDKLELELGRISYEGLRESLTASVSEVFRKELVKKMSSPSSEKTSVVMSKADAEIRTLSYFLETGGLPWWTNNNKAVSLNEMLAKSIKNSREELKRFILEHEHNPAIINRLLNQFDFKILAQLVEELRIPPASPVSERIRTVVEANSEWNSSITRYYNAQEQLIHELLGSYLIRDFASTPNNIQEETALFKEVKLKLMRHYLYFGRWIKEYDCPPELDQNKLLKSLINEPSAEVHLFITEGVKNENFRNVLCHSFDEDVVFSVVKMLIGNQAKEAKAVVDIISKKYSLTDKQQQFIWSLAIDYLSGIGSKSKFKTSTFKTKLEKSINSTEDLNWTKSKLKTRVNISVPGTDLEVLLHFINRNEIPYWLPNAMSNEQMVKRVEKAFARVLRDDSELANQLSKQVLLSRPHFIRLTRSFSVAIINKAVRSVFPHFDSEIKWVQRKIKTFKAPQNSIFGEKVFQAFLQFEIVQSLSGKEVINNEFDLVSSIQKDLQQKWENYCKSVDREQFDEETIRFASEMDTSNSKQSKGESAPTTSGNLKESEDELNVSDSSNDVVTNQEIQMESLKGQSTASMDTGEESEIHEAYNKQKDRLNYEKRLIEKIFRDQLNEFNRNKNMESDKGPEWKNPNAKKEGEIQDEYFVDNAGLVIISPYLGHLFTHNEWGRKWRICERRSKAHGCSCASIFGDW